MSFDSHRACLKSCRGPGARAWLSTFLVIPCFRLSSNIFASVLQTKLSLPHPLTLGLTHCICDHPLDPKGIHFFCCAHGGERTVLHESFKMLSRPLRKMPIFMFCEIKSMFSHNFLFKLFIEGSTLFYRLMTSTHWSMLSLLTSLEQTWYDKWLFFVGWPHCSWFK
jgi:hypothetical protein